MQDQPTGGSVYVPEADEVAGCVLTVLLDRYPALVSIEELVQHFAFPGRSAFPAMFIEEGVDDLARAGLAHRLERFVFASQSAVRGEGLRG